MSKLKVNEIYKHSGSQVTIVDALSTAGVVTLGNTVTFSEDVTMDKDLGVTGNLNVVGTATISGGAINIGDADSDRLSIRADLTSNILPDASSTYDLGSPGKKWNYVHASTLSATAVSVTSVDSSTGNFTTDVTVGGTVDGRDVSVDGTALDVVKAASGTWDAASALSQTNETTLDSNSGTWNAAGTLSQSNETTLDTNSGSWSSAGTLSQANETTLAAGSANWSNTYTSVHPNSANWDSTYNQVQDATTDLNVDSGTLFVDKSENRVGIGTTDPATTLDVRGGNLTLTDADIAHGITNHIPTNAYGDLGPIHETYGGLLINGASDQESENARSLTLRGLCNDNHTDTVPLVEIIGAKRSGTTVQALDTSETVLQIANHTTVLATVLGDGRVGIGTAVPGSSLDVRDGRITLTDADVAHGMTAVAATEAYGDIGPLHSTRGGLMINGLSDQESADARSLALRGVCNDTHTDTVPTIELIGAKRSGTSIQALGSTETVLQIANHTTVLATVLGNGNVGIGTTTFDSTAEGVLTIKNGTSPGAATADQVYIGSKDSTGLTDDGATLELYTEATPEAQALAAAGDLTHRTSIWINGVEYYLYLDLA